MLRRFSLISPRLILRLHISTTKEKRPRAATTPAIASASPLFFGRHRIGVRSSGLSNQPANDCQQHPAKQAQHHLSCIHVSSPRPNLLPIWFGKLTTRTRTRNKKGPLDLAGLSGFRLTSFLVPIVRSEPTTPFGRNHSEPSRADRSRYAPVL